PFCQQVSIFAIFHGRNESEVSMQKAIWRVLVPFLTLAALCQQVSATPIVTLLPGDRRVTAQVDWDHNILKSDFTTSLGPADLSGDAGDCRPKPTGDGCDSLNAHSSQHATVDAFGFSYTASLELDYFNHEGCCGVDQHTVDLM